MLKKNKTHDKQKQGNNSTCQTFLRDVMHVNWSHRINAEFIWTKIIFQIE